MSVPSDLQDTDDSEPSREEILAAIRQFIGDDETVQAKAQNATPKEQAEDESLQGKADSQIINDTAPVLSEDAAETAAGEEEILDPPLELGGLEIVGDEDAPAIEVAEVTEVLELEEVEDIATVLSEDAAETAAGQEEILDPALELGGLEIVEDEAAPANKTAEVTEGSEFEEVDDTSETSGDFSSSLLELITELSPCTEERLFIVAATRELRGSENWSLTELKEALDDFVQQLADQGLVKIHEKEIAIPEHGIEHLAGDGSIGAEEPPEAEEVASEPIVEVASQPMASEPPAAPPMAPDVPPPQLGHWASARLNLAHAALRTGPTLGSTKLPAEPSQFQTAPQPGTIAPEGVEKLAVGSEPIPMAAPMPSAEVKAKTHAATEAVSAAAGLDAELQPDTPEPMANAEEPLPVETRSWAKAIKRKAPDDESKYLESVSRPTKFDWAEQDPPAESNKLRGWISENLPRRMRAYVPVEAKVRLSQSISDGLFEGLVGAGQVETQQIQVAQAMSLRLSAPKGGFTIESQSPETQWVWRNKVRSEEDLAIWQFTLTPTRRGTNALRLAFSCKEVGPDGLVADSALPDKVLDIVVRPNRGRFCARAAIWSFTLVLGAALGMYLQSVETKKSLDALGIDKVTIEAFNKAGTKASDLYKIFYSGAEHYGDKGLDYIKSLLGKADSKQ